MVSCVFGSHGVMCGNVTTPSGLELGVAAEVLWSIEFQDKCDKDCVKNFCFPFFVNVCKMHSVMQIRERERD